MMMIKRLNVLLLSVLGLVMLAACGGAAVSDVTHPATKTARPYIPPLSHNDSLRFKMFFFEAVSQQSQGHFDAAYDLLQHCLAINPNSAETYFMLSSYDGPLYGDSALFADVQKAAALAPDNNTYLERLASCYIASENYDGAITAFEKLFANTPDRSDVLQVLVQLYGKKRDYDNVIHTINRMELLDGANEKTALAKMRIYSLQGKKDEELKVLEGLTHKHPNDMSYRVMKGNWLLQNGSPADAYAQYQEVLAIEPENVMARMSLVDYYRTMGEKQLADSLQNELLIGTKTSIDDKMLLMKQVVADNERQGGDSTKVLDLFNRILAKPQETSDMAELQVAYMTLKNMPKEKIDSAIMRVLDISPDNVAARLSLIQSAWTADDFDRVVQLSRQAVEYNPDEMAFYYFLGMGYVQQQDDEKALLAFRNGVAQIDEETDRSMASDLYAVMADILHSMGDEKASFEAYDSCLQWNDNNLYALNNYAYHLAQQNKDLDKAERMSFKTIQAEPGNANSLDTYAWILFKQKRYAEARQYIDMAVSNDSVPSSVVLEHAGDIHAMCGDMAKAVEYWQKALALDETNKVLIRKIKLKKYVEK